MATDADVDHSGSVVEVEFEFADPDHPFVALSAEEECRLVLEEVVPRDADHYSEYFTVEGGDVDRLIDLAAPVDDVDAQALSYDSDGSGGLVELLVTDSCPIMTLAQAGAFLRHVDSDHGVATLLVEIPPQIHAGRIVERFLEKFSHVELVAQRHRPYSTPVFSRRQFDESVAELFTDRQREILHGAYEAGYFEWPRDVNGEDLAAAYDVSPATFHEHLRTAERKLVSFLFDSAGEYDRSPGGASDATRAGPPDESTGASSDGRSPRSGSRTSDVVDNPTSD